jgi:hypothetical protein
MSQENVDLARAAFAAWNAGDMVAYRELCHPAGYAIRWEAEQLVAGCESYRRRVEVARGRPISLEEILGEEGARLTRLRVNLIPAFDSASRLADLHAQAGGSTRPIAQVAPVVAARYGRESREAVKKKMGRLLKEARWYEYTGWDYVAGRTPERRSRPPRRPLRGSLPGWRLDTLSPAKRRGNPY